MINAETVAFINCSFTNNRGRKCQLPFPSEYSFHNLDGNLYNGNGGGLQIGFGCNMNEVDIKFEKCNFTGNKAQRHGGALSIQTLKTVEIIDCIFDSNYANYDFAKEDENDGAKHLEYDTHYNKKLEGRGGAIYINPAYTYKYNGEYCYNTNLFMSNVQIKGCQFIGNSARDGFAMYIEGDDPGTTFIIEENNFTSNYNFNDEDIELDTNYTGRAVITTEIHTISSKVYGSNIFNDVRYKSMVYVDHFGNLVPTRPFTDSKEFTLSRDFSESRKFSKSTDFSESAKFTKSLDFTFSSKFTESDEFLPSEKFTKSKDFSNSLKFSKSKDFSESTKFTKSLDFSFSSKFTESDEFLPSDKFTKSKDFSNSLKFSKSKDFSESAKFTKSLDFSFSSKFTESDVFLPSDKFTKSSYFSNSLKFSKSKDFTETAKFTKSLDFSFSSKFTESDVFLPSDKFTKSSYFSSSLKFSKTKDFTETLKFTKTQGFSFSSEFTKSDVFLPSDKFTKSNDFSNSLKFSKTKDFTETAKFTKTDKFTKSFDFSCSSKFTNSKGFSRSSKFSTSKEFSNTEFFTFTNHFSNTEKFSNSMKFSSSKPFSQSFYFTKSKMFTNTNHFSVTDHFSNTEKFSETEHFSYTKDFTTSKKFSQSEPFSRTMKFTNSNKFSQTYAFSISEHFSQSAPFSNSIPFSNSQDFSPSIEPVPNDPKCGVFDNGEYLLLTDCKYSVDQERLVYIYVLSDNFVDYEQEEGDGSAIRLINCGIHCNNTNFTNCVTKSGGGGAIYINNSFEITNNATFVDTVFHNCKASYGGAVFLVAQSSLFSISFTRCSFDSNRALLNKPNSGGNKLLFGGSALFVMSRNIDVINSTFSMNKGPSGAVKIHNFLNGNSKGIQLEEENSSFHFVGCNFKQHETSKSSIYFVDETSRNKIDVLDCNFIGKLKKGAHYIDGKLINKERINVKACSFGNDEYEAINVDFANDKEDLNNNWLIAVVCFAIFLIPFGFIIYRLIASKDNENKKYEFNDSFISDINEDI